MKYAAFIFMTALGVIGCSSPIKQQSAVTDSAVNTSSTIHTTTALPLHATTAICFERAEGKNNTDSTYVQLIIKGNTVTGEMNWLPFEKDARKGLLTGTKKSNIIQANWTFKQEGATDTMKVSFKLEGNTLAQKPFKTDPKTGRQYTDESADYTVKYQPSPGQRP